MSFATTKVLAPSHSLQSGFLYALRMGLKCLPLDSDIISIVVLVQTGSKQANICIHIYTQMCVCANNVLTTATLV